MYDFDYRRPASLDEAKSALSAQPECKLLAGGMSLLPALKQRLARYGTLVDLAAQAQLRSIQREGDQLVIGSMTPHAHVAASQLVATTIPALAVLAGGIGDPLVRNRGTIGGSIANADPAADYPAAVLGLDAAVVTDQRTIAAEHFFLGLFETALKPNEIITAVRFPLPLAAGYAKFRQPASRFALVGVFVARLSAGVRVAVTGARTSVFRWSEAEKALDSSFDSAALDSVELSSTDLNADIHASADYRAHCVRIIAKRAVAAAQ
jgi:aerobic carbon-monoxide dehydrogenase medium subunit